MRILTSLIAGLIFGLGLVVSGMMNPAKILNFLDFFGTFDPSLIFVMGGAVIVTFIGYRLVFDRARPIFAEKFSVPSKTSIDMPLVAGSALFGLGWGLSGFCPGPALTALPLLAPGTLAFFPAMLAGLWLTQTLRSRHPVPVSENSIAADG
jgi:uncharacterized protein